MCDGPSDQTPHQGQDRAPAEVPVDVFRVVCSRVSRDVLAVRPSGEVDLATAERLRKAVIDAIDAHPRSVLVDLSGLTYCGSAGLAALVHGRHAAAEAGVGFAVVNPRPHVRRVIERSGLNSYLAVGETTNDETLDE